MAPEGWCEKRLEDVFKLSSGDGRPAVITSERSEEMPIPVYGGNGILGFAASYNVDMTTIAIGRVGEYCGVTRLLSGKCWITDNALYAKAVVPEVDIEFLAYRLQEFNLARLRSKGGQPLVSQKPIYAQKFHFPPKNEQERIAEVLSLWDRAINVTAQLIASSQIKKCALVQQLLTQDVGQGPSSPKECTLGDVATILVSNIDKKAVGGERPVRLCNYMDVYANDGINLDLSFMEATATAAQIEKFGLRKGDVIITKDSETPDDIAVPSYVEATADDLVCGYHLAIVRPKDGVDGRYLKFYFEHPRMRYYFASRANGATRFGLTINAIESAPIVLPPLSAQQKISAVIAAAEQEIAALVRYRNTLLGEKKALMQELLTGKRRIKMEGVK